MQENKVIFPSKMTTFDKLKVCTNIDYITDIKYDEFVANTKGDELLYYKYKQTSPFFLEIRADYKKRMLIIEFTGKILKEQYKDLINVTNISQCFNQINRLGICHLDTQQILQHSRITKCDVAKDIKGYSIEDIINQVRSNLSNYQKWTCKNYMNGMVLEKTVSTPRYKKRLTIYNKEKELSKETNAKFLQSLTNKKETMQYFKGVTRLELNIKTEKQIRELFNVTDNDLQSVLHSKANPILTVIEEAIKEVQTPPIAKGLKDYEHELLLKECHYDLTEVEAKVRSLISNNTSITRIMKPYKELHKLHLLSSHPQNIDLRSLIA